MSYKIVCAVLLAASLTNPAAAEPIDEVAVIGTRVETALNQLPNNITVLGNDLLQSLSAVHIQQALSQVPGVNYQRGNGQESLPAIRSAVLTGAGACGSVLVLEEAIPVRGAGFCNVNELFDTHFEQAAQIEVVRGANSAFYGSNSLTGSVNVSLPASGADFVSIELGANQFVRAMGAVNYTASDSPAQGRLYLTVSDDGGYRDQSGYRQHKLSWRHSGELGAWQIAAGATLTDLDQETAGFVVGLDSYRDPVLRRQNLDPEAFRDTQSLRGWLSMSRDVGQSRFTLTPYLRKSEMDFLQHFLPGDPLEQNQQTGFGWQSSLQGEFGSALQWTIGVDADFSDGELRQSQDAPTRGSAFLRETIPAGIHYDYQVDAQQLGAFAHLKWQADARWRVIGGLRVESMRYDYDNLALDGRTRDDGTGCGFGGCRYSRPADRKDRFSHLSPKLELQYSLDENWRLHVAVADSFRAPQATELYRLQRAQSVADLGEVRATTWELGANWQTDSSRVSVSLYQLDQRNLIIRDSDFFNVDGQRTDSTGIEASFLHAFSDTWTLRGAAAYANHQYDSDRISGGLNIRGNDVDTAPGFVGNIALKWQPNSRFSTELELQHQDKYFLDPENLHQYPGHTLLNLRARYQLAPRWQLSLRALNLTDKFYAERADFTSFTDERYFPGEPRSLFGEIRWQFN